MDSSGGYKKEGNLGGARHGDAYQVHVLMLLYERAASDRYGRYADFRLATEMKAAKKFDDAVLSWQNVSSRTVDWLFIQITYSLVPVKLDGKHLFPDAEGDKSKGKFSLHKYLESFWVMKYHEELAGRKQFVIYTNCGLAECVKEWFTDAGKEIECILKLGMNAGQFMKLQLNDEHCEKLLQYGNRDFTKLTEIVRSILIDGREELNLDLVKKYRGAIANKILVAGNGYVRFAPRFIKKNKLNHAERVFRGKLFQDDATLEQLESYCVPNGELITILASKEKSVNTLPPSIDEAEVKEFLNSLIFAINQPNNVGLKEVILNDLKLRQSSPVHGPNSDNSYALIAYSTLQNKIHGCLDSTAVPCMSLRRHELENEFQTIQRTISSSRLSVQTDLFRGEMHNLRVEFNDPVLSIPGPYPIAIITSTRNGVLNSLAIFEEIQAHNFHYFTLKDLQNNSIRMDLCNVLRAQKTSFFLVLKNDCPKFEFASEILAAATSGSWIKLILLTDSVEAASNFFNQCTYTLLEKVEITLDQLSESSQQLLRNKNVLFQGIEVKLSDLADGAVLGKVIKNDTLEKLIQDEIVSIGPTLPEFGIKHYIPRIITRSDTDDLADSRSYSEEQFLDDLPTILVNRRVVVLSSTQGMGKTTLWTKLAVLAKSRFNAKWIFYVKLPDCEKHLGASKESNLIDFLGNHFKLSELDTSLLQCCAGKLNSIYVFLDGFDELPFAATGPAIALIRKLAESKKVFVNTRTQCQEELEKALKVRVCFLKPMSEPEQMALFKSICDIVFEDEIEGRPLLKFVEQLMDKIHSKSVKIASTFVGVPLMVEMLAEIYKPYVKRFQETNDPVVLGEIDLEAMDILQLFEKFVLSAFLRQNIDKQKLSTNNHYTQRMLDQNNILYIGFIKLHSFLGLMSLVTEKYMHLIVHDVRELKELQRQIPLLDSPIVTHVPNFIHGSIAEFFAAKCLFHYFSRQNNEQLKENFVRNEEEMRSRKECDPKTVNHLYFQVLLKYSTVRKFFFIIARQHQDCLDKLEILHGSMQPYPFLWACEENFEELVKRLIDKDSKVINDISRHRETGLHFAAIQDHKQICALLIDNNLPVDARNHIQKTPLHCAASKGCHNVVSLLISRGADINAIEHRKRTPLLLAAKYGHVGVVQLLIDEKCELNTLNTYGSNALHIAALNNHIDVVRALLKAKIQIKTSQWTSFFGELTRLNHHNILRLLVSYEVEKCCKSDVNQTLFWAIRRNHPNIVQMIHHAGASIYEMDERSGHCSYQLALEHRSHRAAKLILTVQKDLDILEYPLHAAAKFGSLGCISFLLERNAEVNAKDDHGQSPLDLALKEGRVDAVYLLLRKGAEISKTMLHATIRAHKKKEEVYLSIGARKKQRFFMCIQALLDNGADVNAVDDPHGRTPLHVALMVNSFKYAALLLRRGASIDSVDKYNRTPLQYSSQCEACQGYCQRSLLNGRLGVKWYSMPSLIQNNCDRTIGGNISIRRTFSLNR